MVRAATRQTTSTAGGTRQGVSRWYATASRTASAVTSVTIPATVDFAPVWSPDGSRIAFANAEEISQWLITEKLISTVPWDDAGPYLRWSVTFVAKNPADENRILGEVAARLGDVTLEF